MMDETAWSAKDIETIQRAAWKKTFRYALKASPFFRNRLLSAGFSENTAPTLEDLDRVPLTGKKELSEEADRFLCVPPDRIVDVTTTSGSTGHPLVVRLTEADLERLAWNEFLSFRCAGIGASDTVLLAVTLDRCFIAGMAYFLGLRKLGAAVVRAGPANPAMHLDGIRRLTPTAIVGVPSFLTLLSRKAREAGMDLASCPVEKLICIGEPIREPSMTLNRTGRHLEREWGARVFSTYGNTELESSLCECEAGMGGHVHPELLHIEAVDRAGHRVPDGEAGELVATSFGVEGMPLIRYRTGDIAAVYREPCPCGRGTPRIGPIVGRTEQKLKLKGTTLFPSTLQAILESTPGVDSYVIIARRAKDLSDTVEVRLACDGEVARVFERLRERFQGEAKVTPILSQASRGEIESLQVTEKSRKRRVFVDERGTEF